MFPFQKSTAPHKWCSFWWTNILWRFNVKIFIHCGEILVETLENDTKDYLITPEGEYLERIIREKKPTGLSDVSYIIDALIVCQKSEAADYKYEEQEAVAYYREYCSAYLNEHYELTEEEIKEVMDGYDPSDKDNQSNLERMMQERAFSHLTE